MTSLETIRARIERHLRGSSRLVDLLVAVLWIGSRSRSVDLHQNSDIDLQFILEMPNSDALLAIERIISSIDGPVDVSIIYLSDILASHGNAGIIDFQDGTKGAFFTHVLTRSVVVYGVNPYPGLMPYVEMDACWESLGFTIREYLVRLRTLAVIRPFDALSFTKYTLKLLKDLLVLNGDLPIESLAEITYGETLDLAYRGILAPAGEGGRALTGNLDDPIAEEVRHEILQILEHAVGRVLWQWDAGLS